MNCLNISDEAFQAICDLQERMAALEDVAHTPSRAECEDKPAPLIAECVDGTKQFDLDVEETWHEAHDTPLPDVTPAPEPVVKYVGRCRLCGDEVYDYDSRCIEPDGIVHARCHNVALQCKPAPEATAETLYVKETRPHVADVFWIPATPDQIRAAARALEKPITPNEPGTMYETMALRELIELFDNGDGFCKALIKVIIAELERRLAEAAQPTPRQKLEHALFTVIEQGSGCTKGEHLLTELIGHLSIRGALPYTSGWLATVQAALVKAASG